MSCDGCAKCGDCCDAIIMTVPLDQINLAAAECHPDAVFITENWTPITSEEAERRVPGVTIQEPPDTNPVSGYYECRQFDRQARLCAAHDQRPGVCRGFPWYNREPSPIPLIPYKRCSFWSAIPVEQWIDGVAPTIMAILDTKAPQEKGEDSNG